jgi:molybdopterin-containing oxidoreductase family iron-sulfur binding subunit
MGISRREFLRIAGLSTVLGLGGKGVFELLAPGEVEAQLLANPKALTAKRWAMVIDTRKLDEKTAKKCSEACHRVHNVPDYVSPVDPKDALDPDHQHRWQIKWLWTEHYHNAFPGMEQEFMAERVEHVPFLVLCNHCENPPCVRVCPTKATFQRPDGIVMMDMHRCIGCRFCMAGCPFGARSFNYRDPRPFIKEINQDYPTREKGVVEKCTFCTERLDQGLMPACVEVSNGAMAFGDLSDPKSKVREYIRTSYTIRRKVPMGTNPQVYYIV